MAAGRGRRGHEEVGGVEAHGGCRQRVAGRERVETMRGTVLGGAGKDCPWSCGYGGPVALDRVFGWRGDRETVKWGHLRTMCLDDRGLGAGMTRRDVCVILSEFLILERNCSAAILIDISIERTLWRPDHIVTDRFVGDPRRRAHLRAAVDPYVRTDTARPNSDTVPPVLRRRRDTWR
jgi:hypothetical protein